MSLQMGAKNTIIYIGGFELPDKNAAAQRVIGNAKALRDIGYEVVFVDIDKDTHESILNTKNEIYGFIRYSMQYTNKRLVSIADFKLVFSEYGSSICAIIAYNYPSVALSKMRKFCKLQNVKIIADCTEWYGAQGKNFIKMIIKGMDSFFRMNVIQPKLDGIITISRYLENYYKEKIPTICVPPLVDLSDIKWATKEEKKRNEVRIVYAGNPGMHKDKVNRMVEALAKINRHDTIFEIIGITKSDFLEYYPNEKKSVQMLGDRINFRGRISHECVIKAIKQADFSMFYRNVNRVTTAGFPTKFSESISCGTPVITNRTSNLEEYLRDGVNGFWIDDDIEKSICRILQKNILLLKNVKKTTDINIFDYRNYLHIFKNLF